MCDRARAGLSLEIVADAVGHACRAGNDGRDEVGGVDRVVKEQMSAGSELRCPVFEIGAHAPFTVVAIDEEDVDLSGRRLGTSRVRDVQLHAVREPVALEHARQLAVELGTVASLTDVDVVGVEHSPIESRSDDDGAAAAVAADLHDELGLRVAHETVQERRLVQPE
jgi:hypothetical protein